MMRLRMMALVVLALAARGALGASAMKFATDKGTSCHVEWLEENLYSDCNITDLNVKKMDHLHVLGPKVDALKQGNSELEASLDAINKRLAVLKAIGQPTHQPTHTPTTLPTVYVDPSMSWQTESPTGFPTGAPTTTAEHPHFSMHSHLNKKVEGVEDMHCADVNGQPPATGVTCPTTNHDGITTFHEEGPGLVAGTAASLGLIDSSFTFMFWAKTTRPNNPNDIFLSGPVGADLANGDQLNFFFGSQYCSAGPWHGASMVDHEGNRKERTPSTTWTHYAFIYDQIEKTQTMYVDGVHQKVGQNDANLNCPAPDYLSSSNADKKLMIGTGLFVGQMAGFELQTAAVTAAKVRFHMEDTMPLMERIDLEVGGL